MAEALLKDLRPYLVEAKTVQQEVTFGGHAAPALDLNARPVVCRARAS